MANVGMGIRIGAGKVEATAQLNDTRTAQAIWETLLIAGPANLWGDEIRPASPVSLFGRVIGDPTVFKDVPTGTQIAVRREQ